MKGARKPHRQLPVEKSPPITSRRRPYDDAAGGRLRLKGRREFERDQQAAPPPEQSEDYGIIEWDKEKCWW